MRVSSLLPRSLTNRVFALYSATLVVFVVAGLGLFLKYQFTQQIEDTQQASIMLIEVVTHATRDSVVIGDYDTVRKTLDQAVQGSFFASATFIDMTGGRVHAESRTPLTTHPPDLLVRWVHDQLYDVNNNVSVGGKDYGVLRLQYDAPVVAARLWSLWLVAMALGILSLVGGLLIIRIPLKRWLGSLDRLRALEARLQAGTVAPADLEIKDVPLEIRGVVEMFRRTATLMREREADRRELDLQKFALDQHAIVSITDLEGRITYANDRFCEISGYQRGELLGQNHRLISSGHHPTEFFADMWQTISSGQVWRSEICNRKRSGEMYWVSATIVPLLGENGKPERYIAIRTDISDRKAIEGSLQAAKEYAEQANQSKSEFLANMSHEIRTPMNGIIGMTELALSTDLTPEQRQYLMLSKRSSHALLTILNDILDFSKIEAGKLSIESVVMSPAEVIRDSLDTLSLAAEEKGLKLVTRIDPKVPEYLMGDPGRLRQLILNLVGNAIKFTEKGGVAVMARVESREGNQVMLHFAVKDSGLGIPKDKQKLIFEAFAQEDASITRKFGGTGLGLAICSRLTSLMGGRIWLDSEPGKGSIFHFTLLMEMPTEEAVATRPMPLVIPDAPEPEPVRRKVLVVEDHAVNQMLATMLLERAGHEVTIAPDGQVALDKLEAGHYDLVFMDMHMPVMDGLEATRRIRARERERQLPRVPIVAMTANAMDSDRAACLEAGMDDFISKPFNPAELHYKLQTHSTPPLMAL